MESGRSSIKRENILKPVNIALQNNTAILEATLRKSSREVIHLKLDSTELQMGRVPLSWDILEHNDGGVVQLIYAGGPDVSITVDGVIEGQPQILLLTPSANIKSADEQFATQRKDERQTGFYLLLIAVLIALWPIVKLAKKLRPRKVAQQTASAEDLPKGEEWEKLIKGMERTDRIMDRMAAAGAILVFLACLFGGVYLLVIRQQTVPPFGF